MKNNIKNCGIYEIINTTNKKKYIGSSKNLYSRHQKHFSLLRHNKHENQYLQNSWNKHGEDSFEFNLIEYCEFDKLTEREQYYIDLIDPEYNITREVVRNTPSKESRLKHSLTKKRMYASGELKPNKTRDVYQYGLDGVFIKKWNCIKTACKSVGIVQSTIHRCLSGKHSTAGGYIWKYEYAGDKISQVSNYKKKKYTTVFLYKLTNISTGVSIKMTMNEIETKFNVKKNTVGQYIRKKLNFKKQYQIIKLNEKVKIDLVKSGELLETPEMDNQQLI